MVFQSAVVICCARLLFLNCGLVWLAAVLDGGGRVLLRVLYMSRAMRGALLCRGVWFADWRCGDCAPLFGQFVLFSCCVFRCAQGAAPGRCAAALSVVGRALYVREICRNASLQTKHPYTNEAHAFTLPRDFRIQVVENSAFNRSVIPDLQTTTRQPNTRKSNPENTHNETISIRRRCITYNLDRILKPKRHASDSQASRERGTR